MKNEIQKTRRYFKWFEKTEKKRTEAEDAKHPDQDEEEKG